MRTKLFFLLLLLSLIPASAQTPVAGRPVAGPTVRAVVPAAWPDGYGWLVTDCESESACATGGGTLPKLLIYDASAGEWLISSGDTSGSGIVSCVSSTPNDAYEAPCTPAMSAVFLADGAVITFRPTVVANTGEATITFTDPAPDLGPYSIYKNHGGQELDTNNLLVDETYIWRFCAACNAAAGAFIGTTPEDSGFAPASRYETNGADPIDKGNLDGDISHGELTDLDVPADHTWAVNKAVNVADNMLIKTVGVGGNASEESACSEASGAITCPNGFISGAGGAFETELMFDFYNGGSVLATGQTRLIRLPYACLITQWELVADQSGSVTIDLYVDSYANWPPTGADSITASSTPALASVIKNTDTTVTDWTELIPANSYILATIEGSPATLLEAWLSLDCTRQ